MATQDQNPNTNPEHNQHTPNPHEHPQNASGKAGKELSSEQQKPEFDQSLENEATINQPHATQSQLNPTSQSFSQNTAAQHTDHNKSNPDAKAPTEKDPVDRPLKDENGELI